MNNNDKTVMYRTLAVLLAIAAIVFLVLWLSARGNVEQATEEFRGDLSSFKTEIARRCTFSATSTDSDREDCEDVLQSFGDVLRDYSNLLIRETGTSTMPTSTPSQAAPSSTSTSASSTRR